MSLDYGIVSCPLYYTRGSIKFSQVTDTTGSRENGCALLGYRYSLISVPVWHRYVFVLLAVPVDNKMLMSGHHMGLLGSPLSARGAPGLSFYSLTCLLID